VFVSHVTTGKLTNQPTNHQTVFMVQNCSEGGDNFSDSQEISRFFLEPEHSLIRMFVTGMQDKIIL
jgi:hypothetical protein